MGIEDQGTGADATSADASTAAGAEASAAAQPADTLLTGDAGEGSNQEQAAGAKKDEATEGDGKQGKEDGEKPQGAPESYADFTVPEGVTLDPELMTEFGGIAKELNLSQEQAQKLADLGSKLSLKNGAAIKDSLAKAQGEWLTAARSDKEFGGDKLGENLAVANKALSDYGSPELIGLLKESALGNHPEFIRLLYRVGKATASDTFVPGGTASKGSREISVEDVLYPQTK